MDLLGTSWKIVEKMKNPPFQNTEWVLMHKVLGLFWCEFGYFDDPYFYSNYETLEDATRALVEILGIERFSRNRDKIKIERLEPNVPGTRIVKTSCWTDSGYRYRYMVRDGYYDKSGTVFVMTSPIDTLMDSPAEVLVKLSLKGKAADNEIEFNPKCSRKDPHPDVFIM